MTCMPYSHSVTRFPSVMQVSWSGVPNPTAADAVALVIPTSYAPDCDLHKTVPLKYRWALQTNPDYLSTGSGSTT